MMNQKDIAEIRRRLSFERNAISCIRGCYVQKDGMIISSFSKPLQSLPREEAEKYLAIFRRSLSGVPGQNLINFDYSPEQVMTSEPHHLLMSLRDTALMNDELVEKLCENIIASVHFEENYLILMMHDGYDVPYKGADGETDRERSSEVFRYILCAICPVKLTKPSLSYFSEDRDFHARESDWVVAAPALAFMFPAFSERSCDIYGALLYSRDTGDPNADFVDAVMGSEPMMPADMQRQTFSQVLEDSLEEECSLEAVQAVQDMVLRAAEESKARKQTPDVFSADDVQKTLVDSGVSLEKAEAFADRYAEEFGPHTVLSSANVAPTKQFEVKTPSVSIRVDPEKSDLVETRTIDGHRYILIRVDENVTVNGVSVRF